MRVRGFGLVLAQRFAMVLALAVIALTDARHAEAQEPATLTPAELRALVAGEAGNVVIVNFWATWCPPCLREFPDIIDVYGDYGGNGLAVFAVSMNEADESEDIAQFLADFSPPFPIYRAATVDSTFFEGVLDTWYGEMPMTLIFDRGGELAHAHKKPLTYAELAADVAALQEDDAR